jgi:hypothetical protein
MATAIVLYGPKAVGKSWVAQALADRLGVEHVDVDALVLGLLATGVRPDPTDGWLAWVEQRVVAALDTHQLVSVEATGAWDSDWRLADDLAARAFRSCGCGCRPLNRSRCNDPGDDPSAAQRPPAPHALNRWDRVDHRPQQH